MEKVSDQDLEQIRSVLQKSRSVKIATTPNSYPEVGDVEVWSGPTAADELYRINYEYTLRLLQQDVEEAEEHVEYTFSIDYANEEESGCFYIVGKTDYDTASQHLY